MVGVKSFRKKILRRFERSDRKNQKPFSFFMTLFSYSNLKRSFKEDDTRKEDKKRRLSLNSSRISAHLQLLVAYGLVSLRSLGKQGQSSINYIKFFFIYLMNEIKNKF